MLVYGKQVVFYILENHRDLIEEVMFAKEVDKKIFNSFAKLDVKISKIDERRAQGLSQSGNHQGFLLQIKDFDFATLSDIKKKNFIVFLDEITDVGNIGAIVRSSYALGAGAVIISGFNELKMQNIIRTSSGAALDMPIVHIKHALDAINELKMQDYDLIATDTEGKSLKNFESTNTKKVLILGSEGKGVNKKIIERSTHKVKIQMKNGFDSLNVSAAAAILIYGLI